MAELNIEAFMSGISPHPFLNRPLAANEDDLHPDDLPAAKVAGTSATSSGNVEAANDCIASDPQPEEESSDDDVQEIPTPTKPNRKPMPEPRAWPQSQPAEPSTPGRQYREALKPTGKIWNALVKELRREWYSSLPTSSGLSTLWESQPRPGVGGHVAHVPPHMDSLILEPIRLRLDKDSKNPEIPLPGSDGRITIEPHTYEQDARGRGAAA
ncbi:hypothetical protein SLS63_006180 [Diaporthe eres]|uniref:Uncharacterized protein n=1 Tax=Diaporthe eres TaxID=83184 RepID=A0ABR1P8P9_DIAER